MSGSKFWSPSPLLAPAAPNDDIFAFGMRIFLLDGQAWDFLLLNLFCGCGAATDLEESPTTEDEESFASTTITPRSTGRTIRSPSTSDGEVDGGAPALAPSSAPALAAWEQNGSTNNPLRVSTAWNAASPKALVPSRAQSKPSFSQESTPSAMRRMKLCRFPDAPENVVTSCTKIEMRWAGSFCLSSLRSFCSISARARSRSSAARSSGSVASRSMLLAGPIPPIDVDEPGGPPVEDAGAPGPPPAFPAPET